MSVTGLTPPARCCIVVFVTIPDAVFCRGAGGGCRVRPAHNPNWKPKLGVLGEIPIQPGVREGRSFTSMQLRLDPERLDDTAIAAIKDKIQRRVFTSRRWP